MTHADTHNFVSSQTVLSRVSRMLADCTAEKLLQANVAFPIKL